MPKAPPSLLIWLVLWQLMGRYGFTVTRNRSFLILGSLISMGSSVGTRTISSMGGAHLPVGGMQGGHKGYALSVMVALFGGTSWPDRFASKKDGSVGRIHDTHHRPWPHGAPGNHPGRGPTDDEIPSKHPPDGRIERGFLSGRKIRQDAPRAIGPGHPGGSHHLGSGRSPLRPIRGP